MKDEGALRIDIPSHATKMIFLYLFADDGLGMDEETASRLLNGQVLPPQDSSGRNEAGHCH